MAINPTYVALGQFDRVTERKNKTRYCKIQLEGKRARDLNW